MKPAPAPRGFTLIELVAVLAIFSLVAVMGLQALTGGLRARSVLEGTDTAGAELVRTVTLLRRDIEALVPVPFRPPAGREEPALHAPAGAGWAGLTLAGQPRLPDEPGAGVVRVEWRLDPATGVLSRRVWTVATPRAGASPGPAVPMLAGVQRFEVASMGEAHGWRPAFEPGDEPALRLPRGVEVRLETERHGPLRMVVVP